MDKAIALLIERMKENGIATGQVGDDRVLAVSKTKLLEVLKSIEDSGKEYAIILIQNPNKVN